MAQEKRSHWPISVLSSASALINMLMPLVLVRLLAPEEVGAFKIFFLYAMLLPAFALTSGVINGLAYWAGREKDRERAFHVSSTIVLGAALAFLALTLALRAPAARHLEWPEGQVTLLALAVFGAIASVFYEESSIASGRIWRGAIFYSGFELARTASILLAGVLFRSVTAIFAAHTGMMLLKTALGYWLGHRAGLVRLGWDAERARAVARYAFPVSLAWAFGIFVNYADQVILSAKIPAADFALYTLGCLSVPPLTILEHSVTRVLIPQLSESFDRKLPERASRLYRKAVEELAHLLIPAVAGMAVFAGPIVEVLFTTRYAEASHFLRIYAFSYLALVIPYDSVPRARGQARWILGNFVFFSALAFGLCLALTIAFGTVGALAGILVSKFAMRGYGAWYVRRSTGWSYAEFLPLKRIAGFTLVAAALGAGCLAARPLFSYRVAWFLVCGSLFAALYLLATLLWRHRLDRREEPTGRVLMLSQYIGIGGLERMVLNLSIELKRRGAWAPYLMVFEHRDDLEPGGDLLGRFKDEGIVAETFEKKAGFSWETVARLCRFIVRNDIQVIHTHDLGPLIYGVIAKILLLGKVRIVHTQHSLVHLARKRRYRYYERFFTFFCDRIASVSPELKQGYLDLGVPEERVSVIGNGIAFAPAPVLTRAERLRRRPELIGTILSDQAREALRPGAEDLWILYLARLFPGKGQDHALKLWAELDPAVRGRARLLLVGPDSEKSLRDQLEAAIPSLPDADRVHLAGPSQVPLAWLQASDISLSCSEFEGMPLSPIEAGGAGIPLVLSRIPGHALLEGLSEQFALDRPAEGARRIEALAARILSGDDRIWAERWQLAQPLRAAHSLDAMAAAYEALYQEELPRA